MPTRRIKPEEMPAAEIVIPACKHPDHTPKTEGLDPGPYVHTCDGCRACTMFVIAERDRMG